MSMQSPNNRILAVDVYRGIVMLLLLPDVEGGFSFYKLAQRFPDNLLWTALASQFTHAPWSGATIWDLIMPSFVFLVGVAMPLSAAARRHRADTERQIFGHVLLRACALIILTLLLRFPARTYVDELWPFFLIAAGLPVAETIAKPCAITDAHSKHRIELGWWFAILAACAVRVYTNIYEIGDYQFELIFPQLALASVFAFIFVGRSVRVQIGVALAILAGYWCLFALYPLPGPGFDPAAVGIKPGDEIHSGFFAHWNKNANAAFAFDRWFLNLLPRAQPFLFNRHGLQTLSFIPTISSMIFGIMCGELLRSARPRNEIRNTLLLAGTVAVAAGLLANQWLCPIVKSLWTPSWTLLSSGLTVLILAALYRLCDKRGTVSWTIPFAVLGTNSILLYVLATHYRWRFLYLPQKLFGADIFSGPYSPLLESVAFAAALWVIAWVLYRLRIFIRI